MTKIFLAYPAVLRVSFSWATAGPSGLEWKCHSLKNFTGGERKTTPSFSASVPMPRCSFQVLQYAVCLAERDRSVSGFPIISGCSLLQCQQTEASFLSVCRSWWWIIKGLGLPENTDVSTLSLSHTHTSTLSYWMDLPSACNTVDGKWGLIMQAQWENWG